MNKETSNSETVNQQGNFITGINKGGSVYVNKSNQIYNDNNDNIDKEKNIDEIINEICQQLAQQYSNINTSSFEKQIRLKLEIQRSLQENPELKKRFINSLKAGGYELAKVVTNNPFVSVPLEIFKGWFEV